MRYLPVKSQYKKLLSFAYVPQTTLASVRIEQNLGGDDLLAYFCFAFDKVQPDQVIEKDS